MNREAMKQEAVERLEILKKKGLMGCVLRSFAKKDPTLYMSEWNGICGALYYMNDLGGAKQEWIDAVNLYEMKSGNLVYHVTHEYTNFGELLDLWFVYHDDEDWDYDKVELNAGYSYVHTVNLTYPENSESGSIAYRVIGGGLVRTC